MCPVLHVFFMWYTCYQYIFMMSLSSVFQLYATFVDMFYYNIYYKFLYLSLTFYNYIIYSVDLHTYTITSLYPSSSTWKLSVMELSVNWEKLYWNKVTRRLQILIEINVQQVIELDWWAVSRDSMMYGVAVISLIFTLQDDKVDWYEAVILVTAYTLYILGRSLYLLLPT